MPSRFDDLAGNAADETDDLLTVAYAPAVRPEFSLFDHVLGEPKRSFVPPLGSEDHSWVATPLPASAFAEDEQTCLANGIYFEARGEEEEGQAAVAQVILNRVRNPAYPDTICGVVYQNQSWKNRCQFSFAC
ncbi:MAG: cell wall hydrolase, partial [Nisaea sp.]